MPKKKDKFIIDWSKKKILHYCPKCNDYMEIENLYNYIFKYLYKFEEGGKGKSHGSL